MATVLREAGWSTMWVGKNHNVPVDEQTAGASKKNWPLGMGFDRYYGFLNGETNEWYPDLVEDNRYIEQPYSPEEGYHLSKDLADKAIAFIRDVKQSEPAKPWYLWFCPGANHAPHHAPQEYIDKYKGKFDDGYEAYREWVLPRMIERGLLPEGTELTPLNPMPEGTFTPGDTVRPWDSLSAEEKALFCRLAECYAGLSEYTDAQVGRIVDYLEQSGQLENTLIIYAADNGASAEGGPNGSVNENKFFNAYPDLIEDNLPFIDKLGTPDTYNHYPTGQAAAFSTPFRMFKRYCYQGGVCDPLVIHWPAGIKARGEVRNQYHHSVDIVPTILDCCGVEMPNVVNGVEQTPLSGVSMRYTFDADGPTHKQTQYYEMMGHRGIWHEGWKAVTEHGPMSGHGAFEADRWQLFHTDVDRSEARDVADQHPEKVEELKAIWHAEAEKYNVLPLNSYQWPGRRCSSSSSANITSELRKPAGTPITRARPRCPSIRQRTPTARSRSSPRSTYKTPTRAASSSHRAPGSAATRCSSRTASSTTPTTSSASATSKRSRLTCRSAASTSSGSSSPSKGQTSTTSPQEPPRCTSTIRLSTRARCGSCSSSTHSAAKASASATTPATLSAACTSPRSSSAAARSSRSSSMSPTRPTKTPNNAWPRSSPATDTENTGSLGRRRAMTAGCGTVEWVER